MKTSSTTLLTQNSLFRDFRLAFEKLTALPLDILAPGEFRIPEGAPDFWKTMGLADQTCKACHIAHGELQKTGDGNTRTAECFAGMTSSSVPVKVRGKTLAFLQTGHVFLGRRGRPSWQNLRRFIERHGLDPGACEQALQAARSAHPAHYQSAIKLLEIFAKQLSETLPSRPFGETYPAIEQACRMMRDDLEQDWTLPRVAKAVKMNPSYFSDVFCKSTGETFSGCLARLRIERACRMLESTRLGVGEIAFAAGFRSISQFNRTFKKLIKLTPREFRQSKRLSRRGATG